mgnify:CR=1 FL=1
MTKQATVLLQAKQDLKNKNIPFTEIGLYGYVALIGHYGSDEHICEVARLTSSSTSKNNESLIRYLMRKRHSSPFEFCNIEFEVALPIMSERQWIRHRTGKTNEVSARYSELPGEVWNLPDDRIVMAPQVNENRQGSGDEFPNDEKPWFKEKYDFSTQNAINIYREFLEKGMAPEIARSHLPLSTFTRKRWSCDLHNLLHFLGLRMDPHAQKEIRDYADAVAHYTKQLFPITYKAFEDYRLNAITFSATEIELLRSWIDSDVLNVVNESHVYGKLGKTELIEFKAKLERLLNE